VLLIHGVDGLDEVSNIGDTEIVELKENKINRYIVSPKDFGIKKAKYDDIKAVSVEQNIIDFLKILFNKERGPKRDIVLMNAAASLYIMDKVSDFKEGVELAKQIIEENKAANKLSELVKVIGDIDKLNHWKKKANII
jgi:anthranilate phosphoribosyltransferase